MNENLKQAIEFVNQVKKIKAVKQMALFGSVARGEDRRDSDIDIAIIYDDTENKFSLMKKVNEYKIEKIQTTFINIKDLDKETELMGVLSGEGLLLYGRPIVIKEKKELVPKVLVVYSLAGLPQTEKVKVSRALYGSISKSAYQEKKYLTETKGLVSEVGIEKISKGVLLLNREKSPKLVNMLKRFKVKVQEIPLWSYH